MYESEANDGQLAEKHPGLDALSLLMGITGLFYILTGFPWLSSLDLSGFLFIGTGIVMFVVGWFLRKQIMWSWWGALILNIGNILFGILYSVDRVTSSTAIALGVIILFYLLVPEIRRQFI
ncbi:MAG: hypothetical protein ACFFD9_06765 [Candidatus Thorarchaeota archaeon]